MATMSHLSEQDLCKEKEETNNKQGELQNKIELGNKAADLLCVGIWK